MKKIILLIAILSFNFCFSQEAILDDGKIKIFNETPRVWKGENGFKSTNFAYRYTKGFRNVIQPILTEYQKRGPIYLDTINDVYTYEIIAFNLNEIEKYDQSKLDTDTSAQKMQTYENDGKLTNTRIWARIMREYDSSNITQAQFEAISIIVFDATLPLELGLWKVAKSRLDAITPPTNSKMLAILDKIKEIINNYILLNY